MNCSGGEILVSSEEIEGCGANILRRNVMREVHDHGRRINREDHPFHRPDKIILSSEIGEQRDNGHNTVSSFGLRVSSSTRRDRN